MADETADAHQTPMRATGLFAALAVAHLTMLSGKGLEWSLWAPFAFLWQDALVALGFAIYERVARKSALIWPVYGLLVAYAALNAAVARILPTPLTPSMLNAARGPLLDSILQYVTVANVAICFLIVAIAVVVPMQARRVRSRPALWVVAAIPVVLVAIGPLAQQQIETRGLHRNAFAYLLPPGLPHVEDPRVVPDWRTSPFEGPAGTDLTALAASAAGRNLVLIVLESTGAQYLGAYGAEPDPMPNLTRLANASIVFESAYAVYPESIKGLFSVICSRHPAIATRAEAHAAARCDSLATQLGQAGYRSALFHSGRFAYLGMLPIVEAAGFDVQADAGDIGGRKDSSFGIDEISTVEAVLDWLDELDAGERFFVTYLPIAGHHPYATFSPGPFEPVDDYSRYLNALNEADAALGVLVEGLEQRDLVEETLFVVFGDHSEAFGQHVGNIGHSFYLYEENLRVPFLIAAPGLVKERIDARGVLSLVDAAPTTLELLGQPVPSSYEGHSALSPEPRMALFFTDYADHLMGLRDGCFKMLRDIGTGRNELYDICRDSGEMRNIASRDPERVEVYRERLESWIGVTRALEGI